MTFRDRIEAGQKLATLLESYRNTDAIVLGLPRGGVPVAFEVAQALRLPLDVCIVRKVGAPGQPELGLGAVAEGQVLWLDQRLIAEVGATEAQVQGTVMRQRQEVERRARLYRRGRPAPSLAHRTVIIVDDGIATGGTVRAALRAVRALEPERIVLAVPVAPRATLTELADDVDATVCVSPVEVLWSVGEHYDDFRQTEDNDVLRLLDAARARELAPVHPRTAGGAPS